MLFFTHVGKIRVDTGRD